MKLLIVLLFILILWRVRKENFIPVENTRLLSSTKINNMYQLMKDVNDILIYKNIPYTACGGTLLGLIRNKGIIQWDDDIDIAVFDKHEKQIKNMKPYLNERGLDIVEAKHCYKLFPLNGMDVKGYKWKWPFVDVFIIHWKDSTQTEFKNRIARTWWPHTKETFLSSEIDSYKMYPFGNFEIMSVQNPYGYLDRKFGKDWESIGIENAYDHTVEKVTISNPKKVNLTADNKDPIIPSQPLTNIPLN